MIRIHPTAEVQSKAIGNDTIIWQHVIVLPNARIGNNCNINAFCFIENDVVIGNNVTVKCGVFLWDGITIDDFVQIGPNVTFTNDLYPRAKSAFDIARTRVKQGASIGANATIIGGITLGEYCLIGAGSVVTKDVPNNTLWYGNPAKLMGYVCNCGYGLKSSLRCEKCGNTYKISDNLMLI